MWSQIGRTTLLFGKNFIENFGILSPVLVDLHTQREEYFFVEYFFQNDTRMGSYGLDFFPSFSDHDHLLRIGLHIDICLDREESSLMGS